MVIDIKTLHIGSHILCNGKRERVRGLDEDNGLIIRFPAEYVLASEVEPIRITEELLTELGFEFRTTSYRLYASKIIGYWENLPLHPISLNLYRYLRDIKEPDWYCSKSADYKPERMWVKYLHELEAFLYLTTKTELIKE